EKIEKEYQRSRNRQGRESTSGRQCKAARYLSTKCWHGSAIGCSVIASRKKSGISLIPQRQQGTDTHQPESPQGNATVWVCSGFVLPQDMVPPVNQRRRQPCS